jgi:hypothetical protein
MRNIALAFGNTDKIEVDVDGCINMGVGTINADVIPPFTSIMFITTIVFPFTMT